MLNEAQIEAAARKLCELRGIDPNDETPRGNFDRVSQKVVRLTRLQDCIGEIRACLQVQEAIQFTEWQKWLCVCGHYRHEWADECGVHGKCQDCDCVDYRRKHPEFHLPPIEPVSRPNG